MSRQFEQSIRLDKNNTKVVAIGQIRDGIDEWITPVTVYERNNQTGIYVRAENTRDFSRGRFNTKEQYEEITGEAY
jgi:hypothetical protein